MNLRNDIPGFQMRIDREFPFTPRIINPVKIQRVVIFSADEHIRNAKSVISERMPWINVDVIVNPMTVSNFTSDDAAVLLLDDTAMNLVDTTRIKNRNKNVISVLLSNNPFIHCSPPSIAQEKYPYTERADLVFAVDQDKRIPDLVIPSVIRCAEDKLNIENYSRERRFIFLIVDDEPRWLSQFLPVLYNIIGQRADVMVARTYEEALRFIFGAENESDIDKVHYLDQGHGDDVICIITDVFFPKGDDLDGDAGHDLVRLVHHYYPRISIIIASKAKEAEALRSMAFIMPKGDPDSLETLRKYIHDYTGMGDFILQGKTGKPFYRITDIRELYQVVLKAEGATEEGSGIRRLLDEYGKKDFFSTWFYMHGYRELGDMLRPRKDRGMKLVSVLKRYIKREILRMHYTPLIVDRIKISTLEDLLQLFRTIDPEKIQTYSDNDLFSTWLDRKGYPELAEEIRPIHGSAAKIERILAETVEKWIKHYRKRDIDHSGFP